MGDFVDDWLFFNGFIGFRGLFGSKRSGFWTQTVKQHVLTSVPFAFANHCRFQGVWLRIPVV